MIPLELLPPDSKSVKSAVMCIMSPCLLYTGRGMTTNGRSPIRLLSKDSYPAFHAKPSISRGNSDPRGVLIMAATQGLLDTEVTVK